MPLSESTTTEASLSSDCILQWPFLVLLSLFGVLVLTLVILIISSAIVQRKRRAARELMKEESLKLIDKESWMKSEYKTNVFGGTIEVERKIEDNGAKNKTYGEASANETGREDLGRKEQQKEKYYDTAPSKIKLPASLASDDPPKGGNTKEDKVLTTCKQDDDVYDKVD